MTKTKGNNQGNKLKKSMIFVLSLTLLFAMSTQAVFGIAQNTQHSQNIQNTQIVKNTKIIKDLGPTKVATPTLTKTKVLAYSRPDFAVLKDGRYLEFLDESGSKVAPIMYADTMYLPLRAVCGIMGEPVEWSAGANTVFIGRTLSQPSKSLTKIENSPYVRASDKRPEGIQAAGKAYIRTDILIMYDFEIVEFVREDGTPIYPLVYGGTTYLPVLAISSLMDDSVVIDEKQKTITIGTENSPKAEISELRVQTQSIVDIYEKQSKLYNAATAKILLVSSAPKEDLILLGKETALDYRKAQMYNSQMRTLLKNTTGYNEAEIKAIHRLADFTEYCEHYILIMENIFYMAAEERDYSMFAETFMNFALMSQNAMQESQAAVEELMRN